MHDLQLIRDNPADFDKCLLKRNLPPVSLQIITLDKEKRLLLTELQEFQNNRNLLSKQIGKIKSSGSSEQADLLINNVNKLKDNILSHDLIIKEITKKLNDILYSLPNNPFDEVPIGSDENDNIEIEGKRFGDLKKQDFVVQQHFEIKGFEEFIDFETASKLSGSRFVLLKGPIAHLERALGQFMLDTHIEEHGYTEVSVPLIVNNNVMFGTAQLPKFKEDQFQVMVNADETQVNGGALANEDTKKWLIPTGEVPLTNIVREQILDLDQLPLRFTALTPCFRAEAGAAGKDTRGMIRQHQFNKVELVSIIKPDQSAVEHDRMLNCAENILKKLDLPYRVMLLSTGDLGFSAKKTYDIEVWLPGQKKYREISSCSNCGDFQARRMNSRYRNENGQLSFVNTLNGSGIAVGRALVAILENYQTANGSIEIPKALRKYMNNINSIDVLN
ncbi:serine--tRNA ligase [Hyphomicrobiales bacterium]|jgi:seryl-tRNA synthetase|nr:serine--tRNA ligase [Hyphomicrobiales bacterium]